MTFIIRTIKIEGFINITNLSLINTGMDKLVIYLNMSNNYNKTDIDVNYEMYWQFVFIMHYYH